MAALQLFFFNAELIILLSRDMEIVNPLSQENNGLFPLLIYNIYQRSGKPYQHAYMAS